MFNRYKSKPGLAEEIKICVYYRDPGVNAECTHSHCTQKERPVEKGYNMEAIVGATIRANMKEMKGNHSCVQHLQANMRSY